MKGKSLFVTGALALSLLAAPATTLASSEDCFSYKNVQIDQGQLEDLQAKFKNLNTGNLDLQGLLKQFEVYQAPASAETPEAPAKEEPATPVKEEPAPVKEEPAAPQEAAPAPAPAPQEETVTEQPAPQTEESSEISAFEQKVVELTNAERAKQGLAPLELSVELSVVAGDKSDDMKNKGYFSHTSPTYGSPFDMMKAYGIDYRTAGENIAMGQTSPQQVVNGWMNSEGHRKNIMNPNFTHIGVGYTEDGNYWTQMFIGK